ALAILDDPPDEESHGDARASERALVRALIDCWQVLSELSLYETAEEVSVRAHEALIQSASPHEITIQLLNFIEMLLSWGLRLERVRKTDLARQKFSMVAAAAGEVAGPFTGSLFRQRDQPAIEQGGLVAAAPSCSCATDRPA